jgi:hypothetical protein
MTTDTEPTILATYRATVEGWCDKCGHKICYGQTMYRLSSDEYVHKWCAPGDDHD